MLFSFVAASFDLGILELGIFIHKHACFVMFVSCMVFSCVARLFRLMDFRTRYFSLLWPLVCDLKNEL